MALMEKILFKLFSRVKRKLTLKFIKETADKKNESIFSKLWKKFIKDSRKQQLKNKIKKNHKKKLEEKQPSYLDTGIKQIQAALKNYEEFIKRDFSLIIMNANALLREWKSNLTEALLAKGSLPKHANDMLVLNLQEITELYSDTGRMLEQFSGNCRKYQNIVKDSKRDVSPPQKLNQLEFQLERITHNLDKGKEMTNLHNNQDYKFINKYLQETQRSKNLSM